MSPSEPRPSQVVYNAIREVEGPSSLDRVAGLTSNVFSYAFKAAEAYGALTEKSRKALKDFARWKKTGKPFTSKQAAYAQDLLRQLLELGAIGKNDAPEYQASAQAIVDALGERDE
jgi:hypothetical protein